MTDYTVYSCRNGGARETERLLPLAAARWAEECGLPPGDWQIARTAYGKPYFPCSPDVHASVTHSGEYWLCALGARPVGIDLQQHRQAPAARISARFFHPEEEAFLRAGGYGAFFEVWAAKESYVKFTGEGFRQGLRHFAVATAEGLCERIGGAQLRLLPFAEGYSLCICAGEIGAVSFAALD